MTLREYLFRNRVQQKDFALLVGVNAETVYNWSNGLNVPRRKHLDAIVKLTNGEVQPGDFYEVD